MKTEQLVGVFERHGPRFPDGLTSVGFLEGNRQIVGPNEEGSLVPGLTYRFHGHFKIHERYGPQFRYKTFVAQSPVTRRGVMTYLTKYCRGIGDVHANSIFDVYGERALAALKNDPYGVVTSIPRLPLKVVLEASQELIRIERFQEAKIELLDLFSGLGFYDRAIDECIQLFGAEAGMRIRRDPFVLLTRRVTSCGFARVDSLYQRLGLPPDRLKRHVAALWHVLSDNESRSTWLQKEPLVAETERRVTLSSSSERALRAAVISKWLTKKVVDGITYYAVRSHAEDEAVIAARLEVMV